MRQSLPALAVTPAMIGQGLVLVTEDRDGTFLGVAAIERVTKDQYDLARLFVEPSSIGKGVGRALFNAAVRLVRKHGGKRLWILSDPFAVGFYERLGAKLAGDAPSDAIPERRLPLLKYRIPSV